MTNKALIAVWGSPNSGKTITSVKLAQALAARKQNVLILCCDALCPSLATIAPHGAAQHSSLGELLSLPALTQEELLRYALPLEASPYIALLGYKKGDNAFTYASYDRTRAVDLLTLARHLADVVLVDCSSYLSSDPLSTVALELADHTLHLHSCSLKSLMFYASYLPLLADARFHHSSVASVLSNIKPEQDVEGYRQVFGGIQLQLSHVTQLEQQAAAAQLLENLSGKEAVDYQNALQSIIGMLFPQEPAAPSHRKPTFKALSVGKTTAILQRIWPKRRGGKK